MSISQNKDSVSIEKDTILNRKENFYKLVEQLLHDFESEPEFDDTKLITITLSHLAFLDALLGIDPRDNARLSSLMTELNNRFGSNHKIDEFHIRF
jgi:hypothetical protein